MPVNSKMMKAMKKEYGAKKGEKIYYAVEMKKKMEKKIPDSHKKMTPTHNKKAIAKKKK